MEGLIFEMILATLSHYTNIFKLYIYNVLYNFYNFK